MKQNPLLWLGGYCALPLACIVVALLFLSACSDVQRVPPIEVWDDMKRQGKFKPQMENDLFADHRDSRVPPTGVVARGHLNEDTVYYTGMVGEMYVGKNPVPITMDLIKKGQAKFGTYCTPCHAGVQVSGLGGRPLGDYFLSARPAAGGARIDDGRASRSKSRIGKDELMSAHTDNYQMETARWSTGRNVLMFAALASIILCVVGYLTDPTRFFRSYMVAFAFTAAVGLASFFFVMVQYLTGSAWSVTVRRIM